MNTDEHHRAIVKSISWTAVVLTLIFMALVAVFQISASHRDLAADLNVTFETYGK